MRENRQSGSEGGAAQSNALSLPLSILRNPYVSAYASLGEGGSTTITCNFKRTVENEG
jgi:hypothetical protein